MRSVPDTPTTPAQGSATLAPSHMTACGCFATTALGPPPRARGATLGGVWRGGRARVHRVVPQPRGCLRMSWAYPRAHRPSRSSSPSTTSRVTSRSASRPSLARRFPTSRRSVSTTGQPTGHPTWLVTFAPKMTASSMSARTTPATGRRSTLASPVQGAATSPSSSQTTPSTLTRTASSSGGRSLTGASAS